MSELKPCANCAGEATRQAPNMHRKICIACKECGMSTGWGTVEEVTATWNRRTQPNEPLPLDELRGLLERLEAECREAGDGHEDYTNGYRWGHRNGQIELLRRILNVREGACESDLRRKPEGSDRDGQTI